jgi:hypothetical protein
MCWSSSSLLRPSRQTNTFHISSILERSDYSSACFSSKQPSPSFRVSPLTYSFHQCPSTTRRRLPRSLLSVCKHSYTLYGHPRSPTTSYTIPDRSRVAFSDGDSWSRPPPRPRYAHFLLHASLGMHSDLHDHLTGRSSARRKPAFNVASLG